MKEFTLYWNDGKKETVYGDTISHALNRTGYGQGCLLALSHYSEDSDKWKWNRVKKDWEYVETP